MRVRAPSGRGDLDGTHGGGGDDDDDDEEEIIPTH